MKNILLILFLFLFMSCSSSIKIGAYKYEVKKERINTGNLLKSPKGEFKEKDNFDTFEWTDKGDSLPIIAHNIRFNYQGEAQAGCTLKSQKLDQETKKDTIYSKGNYYVHDDLLICIEKHYHGYQNNKTLLRIFEQQESGALKLKKKVEIE